MVEPKHLLKCVFQPQTCLAFGDALSVPDAHPAGTTIEAPGKEKRRL
jgi:hypothetical protein